MKSWNKWIALCLVSTMLVACVAFASGCSKSKDVEPTEKVTTTTEKVVTTEVTINEADLLVKQGTDGEWYAYDNDIVAEKYTGVVKKDGTEDWYYVRDGKVDFTYNGYAKNMYGTWYINSGKVDFSQTESQTTAGNSSRIQTTQAPTTYVVTVTKAVPAKKGNTARPGTARPTAARPTTARPTAARPTTARPTVARPTTARPTAARPTTARPTTARPTTKKPTTTTPSVNIDTYVAYAESYAQSLGMKYDASCGNWSTPPIISPRLSDAEMKEDIRETIEDLKNNCGADYYRIWAEPFTNNGIPGEYELYIAW